LSTFGKDSAVLRNEQTSKVVKGDLVMKGVYPKNGHLEQCSEQGHSKEVKREMFMNSAHKRATAARLQLVKRPVEKQWRHDKYRWKIVSALCNALEQMCTKNNKCTVLEPVEKTFYVETVPTISIADFLERIAWYFNCSTQCFVFALEYIKRLKKYKPTLIVNYHTVHQLIATCVKVSAKYFDDTVFNNKFYAQVVGLPPVEINAFEVRLLFFLKFDLYVEADKYKAMCKEMQRDNTGPSAVVIAPKGSCEKSSSDAFSPADQSNCSSRE